jgi:hypothetical protein
MACALIHETQGRGVAAAFSCRRRTPCRK